MNLLVKEVYNLNEEITTTQNLNIVDIYTCSNVNKTDYYVYLIT